MESINVCFNELSLESADTDSENRYPTKSPYSSCADQVVEIPDQLGQGSNYLVKVSPDVDLMFTDTFFKSPVTFESDHTKMYGAIVVTEGQLTIRTENSSNNHVIRKGSALIFIIGDTHCTFSYPAGQVKMLNFSISPALMSQLGSNTHDFPIQKQENNTDDNPYVVTHDCLWSVPVTPELTQNILQIYEANLTDAAQQFYINGKIIEVLALLYHSYRVKAAIDPGIKAHDLLCIMHAAEIIEGKMMSPPSLLELARAVGINDNKLKKLFKILFNNSSFGIQIKPKINTKHMI